MKISTWIFSLFISMVFWGLLASSGGQAFSSTVDHSRLKALDKDFKRVEDVTRACLECHNMAGEQFKKTLHWTWEVNFDGRKLGKRHVINNF